MKNISPAAFTVVFLSIFLQPLSAQIQGQWVATGSMQSPRELNAQVSISGGKVFSMGGVDNNQNILASAELYNAGSGKWTLTGSMTEAREYFPAVVLASGKVLVAGGLGAGNAVLSGAELFDPKTGTWSSAGSLAVARWGHTATLLKTGKVLVTGGCTSSTTCADTTVSELYDPVANTWSTTGSLNNARYYHTAVLLKTGSVLAVGGAGAPADSCELYNPTTGAWSNAANTNAARVRNGTTLLPDGKVLVTGGASGRFPQNSAEIYDPTANTWMLTGTMTNPRYAHTSTLLPDGTVLIAGGEGQSISCGKACTSYIPTAKAEIYNEATGKFSATTGLNRALAYQSTTLLSSGRALTSGGVGYTATCCVIVADAEVYTPLTLTFSATSLDFGVLQIGLTSASQTVTVTNASSHAAKFSSIAASGDYLQMNTCPTATTLNPGQSCTITVTFKPTAAGTRKGAVTLKDNAPGSPIQTIALTGIGATNAVTLLPASLSFPGQTPGTTSQSQSITVYNDGTVAVNITGIGISPTDATFTQTNNCPATLNPNTSCAISVSFTPPDAGNYSETLSVTDSDKSSPQTGLLSGVGLNN